MRRNILANRALGSFILMALIGIAIIIGLKFGVKGVEIFLLVFAGAIALFFIYLIVKFFILLFKK